MDDLTWFCAMSVLVLVALMFGFMLGAHVKLEKETRQKNKQQALGKPTAQSDIG